MYYNLTGERTDGKNNIDMDMDDKTEAIRTAKLLIRNGIVDTVTITNAIKTYTETFDWTTAFISTQEIKYTTDNIIDDIDEFSEQIETESLEVLIFKLEGIQRSINRLHLELLDRESSQQ